MPGFSWLKPDLNKQKEHVSNAITKIISYKLKFTDSANFMSKSLSNLVNNLAVSHKVQCKYGHNYGKCKKCKIKYKDSECSL